MPESHIVTGAGPVGWTVARQLADDGQRVRVLTRSGTGPEHPNVERIRADVSDANQLAAHVAGATAVYHCIHGSKYSAKVWQAELPLAEQVVLAAAGANGAGAVFPESLYSYGRVDGVMSEDTPPTATTGKLGVRTELLRARAASATPTVSVVASDFYGPRVLNAHMGERAVPKVIAGKTIRVMADADVAHSFTYVPDLAAAMIAAAADESRWNAVLHAPTAPAVTQRQMIAAFARAADVPAPKVGVIPVWLLKAMSPFSTELRELAETSYQFSAPFVMDSTKSERQLGLTPTPLTTAAAETVAWWRSPR